MKELKTIINNELRDDELIYILKENEINDSMGVMNECNLDNVFIKYDSKNKVIKFWHEEGLCIILK